MNAPRPYPHRRNPDGSYDSICTACFLTAAHAATEPELAAQESKHICNTPLLSQRGIKQFDSPPQR